MEKNKELTPMMELIEEFSNFKYQNRLTDKDFEDAGFNVLLDFAKSLLPKEKQVIEDVLKVTKKSNSELLSEFEKYKGYSSNMFAGEEWKEFDAFAQGYNTKYNNQN